MATLSDADLLLALKGLVEGARPELDRGQGVKLLYSDVVSLSAPYWTVGLNPGGSHIEPDQWHREDGAHDYRDGYLHAGIAKIRAGGIKLRKQLGYMIAWLGIDWRQILSLNLVPFRSASWAKMGQEWRVRAQEFAASSFWPFLLEQRHPRLVVCFGREAASVIRTVLRHGAPKIYPVGWGVVTADVTGHNGTCILRLPHLSTFRLFNRSDRRGAAQLALLRHDASLEAALGTFSIPVSES